jgi:homoserine dehydrogenase
MLEDKPGAFGTVASTLGRHGVSIEAASQKGPANADSSMTVVVLTHKAKSSDLDEALEEIKSSGVVAADPVKLRMI